MTDTKALQSQKNELTISERFANKVLKELSSNMHLNLETSYYQKQLIQGYYLGIDKALKKAEEDRLRRNLSNKDPKYNNNLAYTWNNVDWESLAVDIIYYARVGLDMNIPNHLHPIPFKNNRTNKYEIALIEGYNGIKYMAENYALDKPLNVIIDLVYSNDNFIPIKKGISQNFESYEFTISNPFDRGEVIGGFGYIEYSDKTKNKLIMMPKKDIDKRKPKFASANFWGGEVTDKKSGKKVSEDGWYEEMCRKTLIREVYGQKHIPLDPRRIDLEYRKHRQQELSIKVAENDVQKEKDITETTDMDYMVESTSQLEQEENKNEYNALKEATPIEAEVVTPNTSNIKEETVVQKNETLFDEPTF